MKMTGFGRIAKLIVAAGLIICVVTAVFLYMDFQNVGVIYQDLRWNILPIVILLGFINHGLRFLRWHLLLQRVARTNCGIGSSTKVFLAGSLLIFTPARVGEIAKSIFARDFLNISITKSLPIIVMERASDVVVMALLSSIGLLIMGQMAQLVIMAIILFAVVSLILFSRPLINWVFKQMVKRFQMSTQADTTLESIKRSQAALISPRLLALNFSLGICSWVFEVAIYALSLYFVGVAGSDFLFLLALAAFPLASLAGSISFSPGGLGATEGALIGLTVIWAGISLEEAVLATLVSRATILGVVALTGVVALLILRPRRNRRDPVG
jgi:uncharacterized protein (TIRG00374 family)